MNMLTPEELDYRIRLDYNKTESDVRSELQALLPDESPQKIEQLLSSPHLDCRLIDGEKRYFRSAARNLFRLDPSLHPLRDALGLNTGSWRQRWTRSFMSVVYNHKTGEPLTPKTFHFLWDFQLTVKPNAVPDGETIRCWLPLPRTLGDYQTDNQLIIASSADYVLSEDHSAHHTIYMEQQAKADTPTVFRVRNDFTTQTELNTLTSLSTRGKTAQELKPYLVEQLPHIVFSERVVELSKQIIPHRATPLEKVNAIFEWISRNIPWVSAREYSTIPCIPDHVLEQGGGDCGEKTLLFLSLCRYNGIPARWQSGFMIHPRHQNLHDWAEVFLPKVGWVAVDVSFGLLEHLKDDVKRHFYLGNRDAFHLAINTGISDELYPPKQFPRSETIDFQRGEVEWRGGNLYFDQWDYSFTAHKIR